VRIASRLLACSLTLSKGNSEVKVIDFLLPIKIDWPRIYLQSHKLFFSSLSPRGSGREGEIRRQALEVHENEVPARGVLVMMRGFDREATRRRLGVE
jgi:hypothetical protein